ncbi:MAG: hypothetical protein IAE78_08805 [Myxococcus sp.]|nr:hypothetical protein [Myxococcus sp.]
MSTPLMEESEVTLVQRQGLTCRLERRARRLLRRPPGFAFRVAAPGRQLVSLWFSEVVAARLSAPEAAHELFMLEGRFRRVEVKLSATFELDEARAPDEWRAVLQAQAPRLLDHLVTEAARRGAPLAAAQEAEWANGAAITYVSGRRRFVELWCGVLDVRVDVMASFPEAEAPSVIAWLDSVRVER